MTLTGVDSNAAEPGNDTASLRINRSGSTANPLTVALNLSGSANYNVDYTLTPVTSGANLSGTTLLIPAGAAAVDLTLTPLDDSLIEGATPCGAVTALPPLKEFLINASTAIGCKAVVAPISRPAIRAAP